MKITRHSGEAVDDNTFEGAAVVFVARVPEAIARRFLGAAFPNGLVAAFFAVLFGVFLALVFVVRFAAVRPVVLDFFAEVDFVAMQCMYGAK
jgi:hypothetical protein